MPMAIVGAPSMRLCGAGERAGEVLEGGCGLQVGCPVKVIGARDACTPACPWSLWAPQACASMALGSVRARLNPGERLRAAGDSVHQLQEVWSQTRHIRAGWVEKGNAYVVAQFSTREYTISLWN